MTTCHFVNLPITYKGKNQTSRYPKFTETKKMHLDTFDCSKFSLFKKKSFRSKSCILQNNAHLFCLINFRYLEVCFLTYKWLANCQQNYVFCYTPIVIDLSVLNMKTLLLRTVLSNSALSGRRGWYAHTYSIYAPFGILLNLSIILCTGFFKPSWDRFEYLEGFWGAEIFSKRQIHKQICP